MKNWEDIAATSEHHAVVEIKKSFDEGNLIDVEEGLKIVLSVMDRSEQRVVRSQLIRLMHHILKWKIQNQERSRSWLLTISNARFEIEMEQKYSPTLNKIHIEAMWLTALKQAKEYAEIETDLPINQMDELTWNDVFEIEYAL